MKKIPFMLFLVSLFAAVFPHLAATEIYKYMDENGNTAYTNDISRIPPAKRNGLKKMPEITSRQMDNFS